MKAEKIDKPDLIILYSGGSDSRLMLKMALEQDKKPLLVYVRYYQSGTHHDHKPDLFQLFKDQDINYREIKIYGLNYDFRKVYDENKAKDYLPNRNMILVSIAAAIAEQEGVNTIWLGANISDVENFYPDCTHWWKYRMNDAFVANIKLEYPLENLTQEQVREKLDDNASK